MSGERPTGRVLAILGPTASGKSALALDVATARTASGRSTEIVAVDAFTIYRGMDIGTAKPTAEERAHVPHHMVDVLDPGDDVTVSRFQTQARAVIADLLDRNVTPLLVGGSGLYFRAVVDDLRFPPTDADVRGQLEERFGADAHAAHAAVLAADPAAAAKIEPANLRRSIRALEVIALTGEPFSAFAAAWDDHTGRYDLDVAYLEPGPEVLRPRIDARAEAMVCAGLLDEAAGLLAAPRGLSTTARAAIGYAEAAQVLAGELALELLAPTIAQRTWAYARRQRSWFRRDPRCAPIEAAPTLARWS